jgi:CrcB protein
MNIILFVGLGGFLGAISRYLISSYIPLGTLTVNILGSFLIGILAMYFQQIIAPEYRALFITGFLGALTTFSTFSLEITMMLQESHYIKAMTHVLLNVVLSITATIIAMILFKKLYLPN